MDEYTTERAPMPRLHEGLATVKTNGEWGAYWERTCVCGWRSNTRKSETEANARLQYHIEGARG